MLGVAELDDGEVVSDAMLVLVSLRGSHRTVDHLLALQDPERVGGRASQLDKGASGVWSRTTALAHAMNHLAAAATCVSE